MTSPLTISKPLYWKSYCLLIKKISPLNISPLNAKQELPETSKSCHNTDAFHNAGICLGTSTRIIWGHLVQDHQNPSGKWSKISNSLGQYLGTPLWYVTSGKWSKISNGLGQCSGLNYGMLQHFGTFVFTCYRTPNLNHIFMDVHQVNDLFVNPLLFQINPSFLFSFLISSSFSKCGVVVKECHLNKYTSNFYCIQKCKCWFSNSNYLHIHCLLIVITPFTLNYVEEGWKHRYAFSCFFWVGTWQSTTKSSLVRPVTTSEHNIFLQFLKLWKTKCAIFIYLFDR